MIIKSLSQLAIAGCTAIALSANAAPLYEGKDHRFIPHKTVTANSSQINIAAPLTASRDYGLKRIAGLQRSSNISLNSINQLPATAAGDNNSHSFEHKDYGLRDHLKR